MKRFVALFVLAVMLIAVLCSCGVEEAITPSKNNLTEPICLTNTQEQTEINESVIPIAEYDVKSYPIPTENIYLYSYGRPFTSPSPKGGYYNCIGGTYLSYTPFNGDAIVLCSQAGCSHSDFSCPAYMGGTIGNIGEYRGMLYACTTTESETQIVCHNPITGEHKVIAREESLIEESDNKQVTQELWLVRIAYGKIYYSDTVYTESFEFDEDGNQITESENEIIRFMYDIESGEISEIPFIGLVYGDAGVVRLVKERSDPPGSVLLSSELRLYDPETWEYTIVAEMERDDFQFPTDPACWYGSKVCYKCANTIYIFDANTGEAIPVVSPKDEVSNYWMLDNKLFYITCNYDLGETVASFYFYDLTDKVSVQLENQGNTEVMAFSLATEGNEYFISTQGQIISKEDFYNENY